MPAIPQSGTAATNVGVPIKRFLFDGVTTGAASKPGGHLLVFNTDPRKQLASYPTSYEAKTSILVPRQHRLYVSADRHEPDNARFYIYNVND